MENLELHCMIEQYVKERKKENFDVVKYNLQNTLKTKINREITVAIKCFFDDKECSANGTPIGSHLFQQNGILSRLASNNETVVFVYNFTDPYKTAFKPQNIKSVIKHPIFCKHHDTSVFEEIENNIENINKQKEAFLFTLKMLAFEIYTIQYKIAENRWMLDNINCKEIQNILAYDKVDENAMINNIKEDELPYCENYLEKLKRIKEQFLEMHYLKKYFELDYKEFSSPKKGIAFGCIFLPFEDLDVFISVNVLPVDEGSRILISYKKDAYDKICEDHELKAFLDGNMNPTLNHLIMIYKENICYEKSAFINEDIYCINALIYDNDFYHEILVPQFFK